MIRTLALTDKNGLASALSKTEAAEWNQDEDLLLTIKGAPDILIERCVSSLKMISPILTHHE